MPPGRRASGSCAANMKNTPRPSISKSWSAGLFRSMPPRPWPAWGASTSSSPRTATPRPTCSTTSTTCSTRRASASSLRPTSARRPTAPRMRRGSCSARDDACRADVRRGEGRLPHRLHLPRGAGRTGCRRRGHAPGNDPGARGRPHLDRGARRGACRCGLHARGFRLRAGPVLCARRHRRRLLLLGEQTLPSGLLRRRGRLDPPLQHLEPALGRPARRRGDHPRPERPADRCRRARLARAVRRGGARLLVLRRRLRAAARERRAAPHAAGHGAARDDRRAADLAQRPARRHGPLPALPPARQPGGASRRRDDPLLDGSPAQVQQELRDAGRRHDPQLAARVRDAHPLGEQGADGAPRKHLPPDRPRAGRRAAALHHAARGLRRQRPEALPLYRSPDLRPLPALPHQRRDPARRADDRRRAQPAAPGRLRRAHRPRRRPLRRTGEDQRERQDARGDQARLQGRRRALRQRPLAAPHLALQVGRRRAAEGLQARHGGLAEAQERHEEGRQGHLAPAHRPLRQAQGLEGLRLLAGQLTCSTSSRRRSAGRIRPTSRPRLRP